MPGDATIVIPQRNLGGLTQACVRGLRRQESECRIVIVDDGSTDGSELLFGRCRSLTGELCVVGRPPRGVTAAWNAGLARVETRFAVLLNNDVVIRGPFLDRLLAPLREERGAISGAAWRVEPLAPRKFIPDGRLLEGWCLAFATELWSRLGGFDESLRTYWSDTDFQCRAARCYGRSARAAPLVVVSSLPIVHLGHRTARRDPGRGAQWRGDRERFLRKWGNGVA
jgi:GT2 family glycosyltransferase